MNNYNTMRGKVEGVCVCVEEVHNNYPREVDGGRKKTLEPWR